MKKLFGNPELIRKNKRLKYWADLDASPDEKEYEVLVKYTIIETIENHESKRITVCAQNIDDAKDSAEQKIWGNIDDNEDVDIHETTILSINKEAYTDEKTIDMFENAQNKKT
jgi:hypothetical protein